MEEYLKEKIENRKKTIDEVIVDKLGNQFIGLFGSVAVVIIGLSATALSTIVGLIVASVAAAAIPLKIRNIKNLYTRKERINNEIKHLENIEESIENNDNFKRNKTVELMKLDDLRKIANDKYTSSKRITLLSYGLTAAGIGSIVINPVCVVAVIPGLIANSLAVNNETKKYASCEEIKKRIDNAHHDIDVINIQNGNISTIDKISIDTNQNKKKKEKEESEIGRAHV